MTYFDIFTFHFRSKSYIMFEIGIIALGSASRIYYYLVSKINFTLISERRPHEKSKSQSAC